MWSAIAQIGIALGISEASKLIQGALLSQEELNNIASKILSKASTAGSEMLNKAANAINNIPQLSGSASIQQHLAQARAKAQQNYINVEKTVNQMNQDASTLASNIQNKTNESWIKQLFTKGKTMEDVTSQAKDFIGGVENAISQNK